MALFLISGGYLAIAAYYLNFPETLKAQVNGILNTTIPPAFPDAIRAIETFCTTPTPENLRNLELRLRAIHPNNQPQFYSENVQASVASMIEDTAISWLAKCERNNQDQAELARLMYRTPPNQNVGTRAARLMELRRILQGAINAESGILAQAVDGPVSSVERKVLGLEQRVAALTTRLEELPERLIENTARSLLGHPDYRPLLQISLVALTTLAAMAIGSVYGSDILTPAKIVIVPTTTLLLITWLWFRFKPAVQAGQPNAPARRAGAQAGQPNAQARRAGAQVGQPNAQVDQPNAQVDQPNAQVDQPNA